MAKVPRILQDDITFKDEDPTGIITPTEDPMVITIDLGPAIVRRVLVDSGASVNILFFSAFHRMKLSMGDVKACQNKVHGFTGQAVQPIGVISLLVELREGKQKAARV